MKYHNMIQFITISVLLGVFVFLLQKDVPLVSVPRLNDSQSGVVEMNSSRVDIATVLFLRQQSDTIVVDVRAHDAFRRGHIAGAINITEEMLNDELEPGIMTQLSRVANIVIYGNTDLDVRIPNIVNRFKRYGLIEPHFYLAGWQQWKVCDLPVVSDE